MMYYWIVKHDGSEDQDIISYREELGTLRQNHVVVESLSLRGASFALGRRISTERTWRDLNDTLVTYLQSQRLQDDNEESALGVHIGAKPIKSRRYSSSNICPGTIVAFKSPAAHNAKTAFSKSRGGIF